MSHVNPYINMHPDQLEEHLSNFLINSWSYSKVMTFARNEKEFEMRYLYCYPSKVSATTIAGQAYHKALQFYFENKQQQIEDIDIIDLNEQAFEKIESTEADKWKIQKTTPSIEECKIAANKTAIQLISNFMIESNVYNDEIEEILAVEFYINNWLTVNGVDIPLPCHLVIDLVIITKDGKLVIIDHKSKRSFSDEKDIKFKQAKQAITYTIGYEAETGLHVDEVWFIENKYSKNRDKSPQLQTFKIVMDDDTRRLYEAMLYEPLRRMIQAVNDADYVYLINESDTLSDIAELNEFWALTMLAEVDDFNVPDNKKEKIKHRLRKIRDTSLASINPKVVKNFKKYAEQFIPYDYSNKDMTNQEKIEGILRSFGIISKVQHTFEGYSSSSYLLEVNNGVPIASILRHKLDIANALNVASVRINKDLFVYEGKSYLAIESGKKRTSDLFWDKTKLEGLKIPIGIDNFDQNIIWDLENHSTPHMLICGATGSGKSVSIISILEYALLAGIKEVHIFDPKYEFVNYNNFSGVSVYNDIEDIELQMEILVKDMQERVRQGITRKTLVIFDEFADAVANSRKGNDLKVYKNQMVGTYKDGRPKMKRVHVSTDKSLEENLKILLQKGRSTGYRIIAATQRASAKVITGDAKVNFPVQVCYRVPKEIDSMVVLDEPGAEALNGRGDGLIKSPEYLNVVRFQSFYKQQ